MTLQKIFELAQTGVFKKYGLVPINYLSPASNQSFITFMLTADLEKGNVKNIGDDITGFIEYTEVVDSRSLEEKLAKVSLEIFEQRELYKNNSMKLISAKIQAPMVMGDIKPYISMIDGTLIESRSKHRTHLKDHNCIEIGNETKYLNQYSKPLESPPGLKEELIRVVNDSQRKKRSY